MLLAAGFSVDVHTLDFRTPLMVTIGEAHTSSRVAGETERIARCVKLLIAAGAPVNAKTVPRGRTALMVAAWVNDAQAAALLIAAGAEVDVVTAPERYTSPPYLPGWNALTFAASSPYDNVAALRVLLRNRAKVETRCNLQEVSHVLTLIIAFPFHA